MQRSDDRQPGAWRAPGQAMFTASRGQRLAQSEGMRADAAGMQGRQRRARVFQFRQFGDRACRLAKCLIVAQCVQRDGSKGGKRQQANAEGREGREGFDQEVAACGCRGGMDGAASTTG